MAGPASSLKCTRLSPVPRRGEAGAGARGPSREATRRGAVHHGKRQPLGKQPAHRPGDGGQAPASKRGLGYLDINLRDQYPHLRCDRHRVGKGWDSCGSSNRHDAGGKGRGFQPHSSGQGHRLSVGRCRAPGQRRKGFAPENIQQALDALATEGWTTP